MTVSLNAEIAAASLDIDKGWAIVVLLCSFMEFIITFGPAYMSSVFYVIFLEEFEESPSLTAWAVNLNFFFLLFSGELTHFVNGLLGNRLTLIIGCALSTIGLLSCYFATSLLWIIIMYGIVTGIGFSFNALLWYHIIPNYFYKYRVIAYAINSLGSPLGMFLYPPLIRTLVDVYMWRGTFLILGAINLNMLVAAAALLPARMGKSKPKTNNSEVVSLIGSNKGSDEEDSSRTNRQTRLNSFYQQVIHQIRGLNLFCQPRWTAYCFAYIFYHAAISAFNTHIVKYGRVLGFSESQVTFLPSYIGIGGVFGRPFAGIIAQHPRIHPVSVFIVLVSLTGIINIVLGFMSSYEGFVIASILSGIGMSAISLIGEVIICIIGVERLGSAISYLAISGAVGALIGSPIAAWIYEMDPSYRWSFLPNGLACLLLGWLNIPSWIQWNGGRLRQRKLSN